MPTIFTKILAGEIPCHKILEDKDHFAFLDIRPINPGHTLVIPKKEVDYIFDMEDAAISGLMVFAKKVAKMIKSVAPCEKVGIMVAGLEVRHAHVHLIPIHSIGDLNFAKAKPTANEELAAIAEKIRKFAK